MEFDFVGGPLAGQRRETSGQTTYLVPDLTDQPGVHQYELKWYAIGSKQAEWYQWVGYFTPCGSTGSK
jgi:hypothetical protein